MTLQRAWQHRLLVGLAEALHTSGVGVWTSGPIAPGTATAITAEVIPQDPTVVVCLSTYTSGAHSVLTDSAIGLQVRIRGTTDPRVALDLEGSIASILNGLSGTFGQGDDAVIVGMIKFKSSAPLGPDANGRHERSINFVVEANVPGANVQ